MVSPVNVTPGNPNVPSVPLGPVSPATLSPRSSNDSSSILSEASAPPGPLTYKEHFIEKVKQAHNAVKKRFEKLVIGFKETRFYCFVAQTFHSGISKLSELFGKMFSAKRVFPEEEIK